jgi:hypothetical protein
MAERVVTETEEELAYQPARSRRQSSPSGKSGDHEHRKIRTIIGILAILAGIYLTISLISSHSPTVWCRIMAALWALIFLILS